MVNPPVEVQKYGQSIWVDNIRRKLLTDGTFHRLIDEYGVVGVTSNPAIFQKAIGNSDDYDEGMRVLLDLEATEIYEQLAIQDIQQATDLFMPVYERTNGRDGYVSLEVSPTLARDTEGTITEAKRLFKAVGRPNVMIKIPATPEGIPAIEEAIAAGINVNVTLIFAVQNYIEVAEAYIKGLERRQAAGEDVTKIASVASFFLSRIDTMVDKILENNIHAARTQGDTSRITANSKLLGQAAVSNAKAAYKRFLDLFYGDRFAKLREAGAAVQRPLWASTGTKNPAYPDTKYVDSLIGKDTVNTLPPETLEAFKDHGTAADTLAQDLDEAEEILDMLAEVGVDMDQVTKRLQDDGVDLFEKAFAELMTQVEAKRVTLQTGIVSRQRMALGIYASDVDKALKTLEKDFFNGRIWNHDGSLWSDRGPVILKIENRLGWLDVEKTIDLPRLKALQESVKSSDIAHVVLLGMGGSSLAPEVLYQTFGQQEGFPALLMLDSTHPAQIKAIEDQIDPQKSLFIVASKSGGTVETASFQKYFYEKAGNDGSRFIAITDPGSQLEQTAKELHFRDTFLNPEDIGGRYSALSYFGMVPAALIGLDLDRFWNNALEMIRASADGIAAESHPGLVVGAVLGALAKQGRDKVAIFSSAGISTFGNWVEQLIAESTGKEGTGILPVVGATVGRPHDYSSDRLFVYLKLDGDPANAELSEGIKALREAGHPRVTLDLPDKYALAGEFFRWEYATAVAGKLLGINPFDEPNVTESKQNTTRLLDRFLIDGKLPQVEPIIAGENVQLYAGEGTMTPLRELCQAHGYDANSRTELLAAQITCAREGDYFAVLAYLPYAPEIADKLEEIRRRLRHVTRRAVTLGYGPRYLHSTGQLHKGGANNGIFFQITADIAQDLPIPRDPYSFGTLMQAQAAGDLEALQTHGRRAFRLHISGDLMAGLEKLLAAIKFVEDRTHD
ncbi:MAG: bifunctional transaldolase/phosoglucose isomerase [bacterium]|nr:bifunctional transaldolase/phosoglucose isomerase [bacterium]